jgi:vacuolar-type H+-ATPase subunit F/Vma7
MQATLQADLCESRITVNLQCANLRNRDILGRSDPFAVLYLDSRVPSDMTALTGAAAPSPDVPGGPRDPRWKRIGMTSTLENNLNPVFAESFAMPYFFERAQRIAVDIYDRDKQKDEPLSLHDFLGSATCTVSSLVRSHRLVLNLADDAHPNLDCGTVTIFAEETLEHKQTLKLSVSVTDLKAPLSLSAMMLSRPDPPTLTISRLSAPAPLAYTMPVFGPPALQPPSRGPAQSDWIIVHGPVSSSPAGRNAFDFEDFAVNHQRLSLRKDNLPLRVDIYYGKKSTPFASAIVTMEHWRSATHIPLFHPHVVEERDRAELLASSTSCTCSTVSSASVSSASTSTASSSEHLLSCSYANNPGLQETHWPLSSAMRSVSSMRPSRTSNAASKSSLSSAVSSMAISRQPVGNLILRNAVQFSQHSFLDYVGAGYEISLAFAIDFTASNGDPLLPGSLHYVDAHGRNEYETAIESVGEILAQYDSDQKFPAYGFGAKLPPAFRNVDHCFELTRSDDPNCDTIDGVLDAYRHMVYNVRAAGPTVFADVLRANISHVEAQLTAGKRAYTILLIITDGIISDVEDTVREVVRASSLPLSVVIVGVGDSDFTDMKELDGDDPNSIMGRIGCPDIVNFVEFRRVAAAPEVLASRVLEEIPDQFVAYMRRNNIEPELL